MEKLWNWNFVGAGDVVTTFDIWFHTSCSSQKISVWQMACIIALLRYVLRMSNQVIFQQYSFDKEWCFKLCHFEVSRKPIKRKRSWVWKTSTLGYLKVNVDRSFLESSGRCGIGDLINDSEDKVLIQFYKEVRVDSLVYAKVLALKEELLVAAALSRASTHCFKFERDSHAVVSWVPDPPSAPWRFHNLVRQCCHIFGSDINWSIKHIN